MIAYLCDIRCILPMDVRLCKHVCLGTCTQECNGQQLIMDTVILP